MGLQDEGLGEQGIQHTVGPAGVVVTGKWDTERRGDVESRHTDPELAGAGHGGVGRVFRSVPERPAYTPALKLIGTVG
jgi:hypothetical protein